MNHQEQSSTTRSPGGILDEVDWYSLSITTLFLLGALFVWIGLPTAGDWLMDMALLILILPMLVLGSAVLIVFRFYFLACGAILFVVISWPTSEFLVWSLLGTWILVYLTRKRESAAARKGWWDDLALQVLYMFRANALCITAGLMIVCSFQVFIKLYAPFKPDAVLATELWLSHARQTVSSIADLNLVMLVIILSTLLLITFYWPNAKLVSGFGTVRKWLSHSLIVLTTITSFTFFTSSTDVPPC